ncbi:acetamidase/formamidase family protein [Flaviflagellibacter deserti]|uniref:Acetamidase/formamidase family protein n=1 Tax=Flaviflagellibacter deserti TaxID=2267266 RepID=A0ABV9Z385_9HYPH
MTLHVPKIGNIKYALSADHPFVAKMNPGETAVVDCAINANDGTIRAVGQQLTPDDVEFPFVNGATGPIEIVGAKKGDMLSVEILDMKLDTLGFTALWPGVGMFPDWVRNKEFGHQTRVMEVKDGFVHWSDKVKLPVRPMIGVIGVAPVHGAVLTVDNGPHGGNLDIQEVTTGSTVMFRVQHDGAHLFLGDCHAIQGDGEANGMGATEIAATLTVRVSLSKAPKRLIHPRIETATHICTTGCARPLEDAMRIAFQEMIYWLNDEYGIPEPEAYMLLGQIAEARCTQVVNPKYSYICKVPKSLLASFA